MTLLWIEGFDSYGTSGGLVGLAEKYPNSENVTANDTVVTGRLSGFAFQWENTDGILKTPAIGSADTIVTGLGYKVTAFVGTTYSLTSFIEDSGITLGINLRALDNGAFVVRRGTTVLGTSANNVINTGQWHYIELKAVIDNTSGSYELRIDGVDVLSASGVDTQAGDGLVTNVWLHGGAGTIDRQFDDWYILDGNGSVNNDFLGSRKVITIFPDGAGDQTNWTPDSGSNFDRVNENGYDDDTSYVETATVDAEDLYNFDDLSAATSVDGVQINAIARVTDVDPLDLKLLSKTGTTTDAGSAQAVSSVSYKNFYRILEEDPDTVAAWSVSGVDGAQFGIEAE